MTTDASAAGPVRRPYRGVPPTQRDAERRERVIDAAMRLFAERRSADVAVAVVCRTAHVTTRQFYEIFGERTALFDAVYQHAADVGLTHVQRAIADDEVPVADRVRTMLEMFFFADRHSELGQALAVLFSLGATSHELHMRRAAAVANASDVMARMLGMARPQVAVLVAAMVELLEQTWLEAPLIPAQDAVDALMAMVVR
jgi:AcrR family transcriptional regulator